MLDKLTINYILGNDPGLVNYGCSLLAFRGDEYRILRSVILKKQFTDLKTNHYPNSDAYIEEIESICHTTDKKRVIDIIVIERFMNRGIRGGGAIAECVTAMIGMLIREKISRKIETVSAASWKNRINAVFDLKAFYKQAWAKPNRIVAHRIDSVLMSLYMSDKEYGTDHVYSLRLKRNRNKLIKDIYYAK